MSLNSYFDGIYVNHLEGRDDRLIILNRQFSELNSSYTLFNAVKHERGAVGNKLSFIKILEQAMSNGEKRVMFCEDDVQFRRCILDDIGIVMNAIDKEDCDILCFHHLEQPGLDVREVGGKVVQKKLRKPWCTQCLYIGNMDKVYSFLKRRESDMNGLDDTLTYSSLNTYCTMKEYTVQLDDYSSIENCVTSRFKNKKAYKDLIP